MQRCRHRGWALRVARHTGALAGHIGRQQLHDDLRRRREAPEGEDTAGEDTEGEQPEAPAEEEPQEEAPEAEEPESETPEVDEPAKEAPAGGLDFDALLEQLMSILTLLMSFFGI